jgi:hypothetical protein
MQGCIQNRGPPKAGRGMSEVWGGGAGKWLGNIFFLLLLCPPLQNILVLVYSRTIGTIEPYLSTVLYINMYINKENTVLIYVYNVDVSLNTLKHLNTSFIITDW